MTDKDLMGNLEYIVTHASLLGCPADVAAVCQSAKERIDSLLAETDRMRWLALNALDDWQKWAKSEKIVTGSANHLPDLEREYNRRRQEMLK